MTRPLQIVYIEDSPDDVFFLRRALQLAGLSFQLQHVTCRREFLEVLQKKVFDVVLSDSRSTDLGGSDAFELMMREAPRVPFYFFTGYGNLGKPPEWLPQGAVLIGKDNMKTLVTSLKHLSDSIEAREAEKN